jgi:hypothetical protein
MDGCVSRRPGTTWRFRDRPAPNSPGSLPEWFSSRRAPTLESSGGSSSAARMPHGILRGEHVDVSATPALESRRAICLRHASR